MDSIHLLSVFADERAFSCSFFFFFLPAFEHTLVDISHSPLQYFTFSSGRNLAVSLSPQVSLPSLQQPALDRRRTQKPGLSSLHCFSLWCSCPLYTWHVLFLVHRKVFHSLTSTWFILRVYKNNILLSFFFKWKLYTFLFLIEFCLVWFLVSLFLFWFFCCCSNCLFSLLSIFINSAV